jgi:hypothetical protein
MNSPMDQIRQAVSKEDFSLFQNALWDAISFETVDEIIRIAPRHFRYINRVMLMLTPTDYSGMTKYIKTHGKRASGVKYYNGLNKQFPSEDDEKCVMCGKWLIDDYPNYGYCCYELSSMQIKKAEYEHDYERVEPYIEHLRKKKDNVKLNALCKLLIFSGLSHVVALSIGDSIRRVNREKVCFL